MTDAVAPSVESLRFHLASIRAGKKSRALFLTMTKSIMGKAYQPPSLDTPTRWNSTHVMLRDCIKFRQVINALLSTESVIVDVDWQSIEDVQAFLEIPAKITLAANNLLIEHCNRNIDHSNQIVSDASSAMLDCLIRHAKHLTCTIASIAKFLDLRVCRDTASADFACDKAIVETLLEHYEDDSDVIQSPNALLTMDDGEINLFGSSGTTTKTRTELQMFCLHPQLMKDVDVLQWWKAHKLEYPKLYRLAMDYLAMPATSVPSNRANSIAKRHFDGRARLGDDMFKAEICVASWLRFAKHTGIELPSDYLAAIDDLKLEANLSDMAMDDSVFQYYLDLDA
ncbi:hypothetical protein AeRB84_019651 [Aphanomyces euteiches]|nr:hypothetical protein AeRB84_019651 [Aphanomyces euteiches]